MRLKIHRNLGSGLPSFHEGEVREVEDKVVCENLIKAGLASETEEDVNVDTKTGASTKKPVTPVPGNVPASGQTSEGATRPARG